MVNRRISKDIKECALRLWDHGWDLEDIAEALGVSRRSCYCWLLPPSPLVGRTRTITRALLTAVEDIFTEDPDLFLDEVCMWLAVEHNIIITSSAIGKRAQLTNVFVRGDRYSLCAAMTINGYTAARVVEGSFDSEEFYDFVVEEVLPHMNPFPEEQSVLVLDNCRIHHNEALVAAVESAGLILVFLLFGPLPSTILPRSNADRGII
ncbi:hypothetical protein DFJ58DRAFT_717593 [Suillus subalutaceus]|uniref:uncharacterized protein n=1 Tax=Suillus subalutaceus TaxID=48586 RepID=UPI001B862C7D|nr:uncharacterized protein DFJ58DRAFT_717593 [Suillus subalutaceus]KAG1844619.1 hypothetical protein DFJ58DRAFT_717593 [Suillus subalutaceus]